MVLSVQLDCDATIPQLPDSLRDLKDVVGAERLVVIERHRCRHVRAQVSPHPIEHDSPAACLLLDALPVIGVLAVELAAAST